MSSQQDWNDISTAIDTIEGRYENHVSDLVQQIIDEIKKSSAVNTADDLDRYIDETVSGDEWVQQSRKVRVVLFISENRDVVDSTSRATDSQRAEAAIRVDVREGVEEALLMHGGSFENPWKCDKCMLRHSDRSDATACCAEEEAE